MIIWWSKHAGVILNVLVYDIWINVLIQTSALVGPLHIVLNYKFKWISGPIHDGSSRMTSSVGMWTKTCHDSNWGWIRVIRFMNYHRRFTRGTSMSGASGPAMHRTEAEFPCGQRPCFIPLEMTNRIRSKIYRKKSPYRQMSGYGQE
jgi:hypothetical protein